MSKTTQDWKVAMQWAIDGLEFEYRERPHDPWQRWQPGTHNIPTWTGADYRRKPTRRTVPLGPEDIKPGMALKLHEDTVDWGIIVGCDSCGVFIPRPDGRLHYAKFESLALGWYSSTDGINWKKCEKEVEG